MISTNIVKNSSQSQSFLVIEAVETPLACWPIAVAIVLHYLDWQINGQESLFCMTAFQFYRNYKTDPNKQLGPPGTVHLYVVPSLEFQILLTAFQD